MLNRGGRAAPSLVTWMRYSPAETPRHVLPSTCHSPLYPTAFVLPTAGLNPSPMHFSGTRVTVAPSGGLPSN